MQPSELARASRAVCEHVAATDQFRRARVVVLYAACRGEIDPVGLVTEHGAGIVTYYPRVEGDGLSFRRASPADLAPGAYGIPEPRQDAPALDVERRDVLIAVPGLAFDREGGRLGAGKGYYDRALVRYPGVPRIGLTLEAFVVSRVPVDAWDIPMDAIATEEGIFIAGKAVGVH